jgi:hypothetical protein
MVVVVKRLLLVCPSEEIQQQLGSDSVDELGDKNLEDPEPVDDAVVEALCDDDDDEEDFFVGSAGDIVVIKLVVSVVIEAEEQILDISPEC